ncbi:DHH family phosphoesterase [Candidatus Microgenomates bacterium]|nr:DHH family phosphoesterase [Candidatus Microgenomates bacterium]
MTNEDLQQIQNLVNSAHKVLVLTHKDPGVDAMASALALYLALSKMGKDVTVAMESQPLVEVANLVGIDKVKTSLEGKNLLLTYQPCAVGDFTNVKYMDEQKSDGAAPDSFKLAISTRDGFTPDLAKFQFSFTGSTNFDLVFTIEVLEPTQAGVLYDQNLFATVPVINIDNHDPNRDYGKFNLVEPDAASISEIVTFFLRAVNTQIDADIAGNLYQGIVASTNNFQTDKVAAATFEAAAICLRSGAKGKSQPASPAGAPQPQAVPVQPQPQPTAPANGGQVPQDWTQPKSYRGTSTV